MYVCNVRITINVLFSLRQFKNQSWALVLTFCALMNAFGRYEYIISFNNAFELLFAKEQNTAFLLFVTHKQRSYTKMPIFISTILQKDLNLHRVLNHYSQMFFLRKLKTKWSMVFAYFDTQFTWKSINII